MVARSVIADLRETLDKINGPTVLEATGGQFDWQNTAHANMLITEIVKTREDLNSLASAIVKLANDANEEIDETMEDLKKTINAKVDDSIMEEFVKDAAEEIIKDKMKEELIKFEMIIQGYETKVKTLSDTTEELVKDTGTMAKTLIKLEQNIQQTGGDPW